MDGKDLKRNKRPVKFKPFWGGAIIGPTADAIDEVIKGVADVGFISPAQSRTGYDIAKASFLFFSGTPSTRGPGSSWTCSKIPGD